MENIDPLFYHDYKFDDYLGFSFSITLIKDGTRGKFCTKNQSLHFDYFETDKELDLVFKAFRFIEELISETSISEFVDCIIDRDQFSPDYFKKNVYSGYHLIGGHQLNGNWNLNADLRLSADDRIFVELNYREFCSGLYAIL